MEEAWTLDPSLMYCPIIKLPNYKSYGEPGEGQWVESLSLQVGDVVYISTDEPGYDGKVCWITNPPFEKPLDDGKIMVDVPLTTIARIK